ncbi:MAG: hypothetical protein GY803_29995 [Chloroflexi bacterium]|nr:hypothetical protein [Chloroflexota bacterium]
MGELQVFLFGKFHIRSSNGELEELSSAKAQELFCYLLLNRDRPHYRETLASVLWDNTPTVQSKRYFRRALWQLQSALSAWEDAPEDAIVLAEGDWIQFNPQVRIWVDAICFEQNCMRTQGILGQNLDIKDVQQLREAIQLYRGSLLESWYQDWCLFERERFRQIYLGALDKLMLYCEISGEYEAGIDYGIRILRYDQAREHTHRRLMRLYCLSGNRTDALRQYEQCASILEEELGIKPARMTNGLYEQIRTARFDALFSTMLEHGSSLSRKQRSLQKVHGELQQIRGVLISMHKQVQRQIEVVESVLREHN